MKKKNLFALLFLSFFLAAFAGSMKAEAAEDVPTPINLKATLDAYGDTIVTFDMPEFDYYGDVYFQLEYDKDDDWSDYYGAFTMYDTQQELYLDYGDTYYFRVKAIWEDYDWNIVGESDWTDTYSFEVKVGDVKLKQVKPAGITKLNVIWDETPGGGYYVYRSEDEYGYFEQVATINDVSTTQWQDTGLTAGKTYYYQVCAFNEYYGTTGAMSEVKSESPRPVKKLLNVQCASSSSVKLSWSASGKDVKGFQIYRSKSKDSGFKRIKTIEDGTAKSHINKGLTFGETYYYKLRSFAIVDGERVYSDFSATKKIKVTVGVPTIEKVTLPAVTKAKVTYSKVPGARGYIIYYATSKNGEYKKAGSIKGIDETSYTVNNLKNGKTYYFKVRAYKKVDDKNYYSAYSDAKKRLMNKAGYAAETYTQKCQRIFKEDYYVDFTSAKQAEKQMKEIKVKTWDIDSNGKKYTRYHYITVHKNIAATVKQIFTEIYNGDEKFPIKDVGGYSWRGDNSSSEHCEGVAIDINPNENAQFNGDTGKPMVGELYKPGKNPYSIPPDGDVVKAFEKYGFSWGNWFWNPDYMHFSYFGT